VQGGVSVPVSVSVSGGTPSVTVLAPAGGPGHSAQVIHGHYMPQISAAQMQQQQQQQTHLATTSQLSVSQPQRVTTNIATAPPGATVIAAPAATSPAAASATGLAATANANKQVEPRQLADLAKQLDPTLLLDDEVSDLLLELADDFVDAVAHQACQLAKHRGSSVLEAKDVALVVERHYGIEVPGFAAETGPSGGGGALRAPRKQLTTEAHRQRLMLIKKAMKKH
uniref:Transcription initiation factor TFIID subunit 12 n=2 Tax=Macrostomum lignano TaxID=282301 RepID=A0A1I8HH23_9PLAT